MSQSRKTGAARADRADRADYADGSRHRRVGDVGDQVAQAAQDERRRVDRAPEADCDGVDGPWLMLLRGRSAGRDAERALVGRAATRSVTTTCRSSAIGAAHGQRDLLAGVRAQVGERSGAAVDRVEDREPLAVDGDDHVARLS